MILRLALNNTAGFNAVAPKRWEKLRRYWIKKAAISKDMTEMILAKHIINSSTNFGLYLTHLTGQPEFKDLQKVNSDRAKEDWINAHGVDPDSPEGKELIKQAVDSLNRRREEAGATGNPNNLTNNSGVSFIGRRR